MCEAPILDLKNTVSPEEWETRINLAACYRLVENLGWGDLIYTHISAKVPNTEHYLVNAFGLSFDEVTASNLVKVDLDGKILDETPFDINPAGFTIHSAIHEARDDAHCVILSSLGHHGYEGLAVDHAEKKRLQSDIGTHNHLLLPNHGALTLGPTVGDAFMRMYDLQRACEIQLMIQATGAEAIHIAPEIVEGISKQANVVHSGSTGGQKSWPAMLRKAYRLDPTFAS